MKVSHSTDMQHLRLYKVVTFTNKLWFESFSFLLQLVIFVFLEAKLGVHLVSKFCKLNLGNLKKATSKLV